MKQFLFFLSAVALCSVVFATTLSAADLSGTWTKKSQKISGTWTIEDGKISFSDFSTRNAPDLIILLSPLTVDELNNKNADQGAVFIAKLNSNKGDQVYTLPSDLDLSAFESIIIHCQQYTKLWGAAPL